MSKDESGIGGRIKAVRKDLGLKQAELGEKLGIKANTVTSYETGTRIPSDVVVVSLCRETHVREQWLRTGEGGMYEADPQADIAGILDRLLRDNHDSFKQQFISALARLDERDWMALEGVANRMAEKRGKP